VFPEQRFARSLRVSEAPVETIGFSFSRQSRFRTNRLSPTVRWTQYVWNVIPKKSLSLPCILHTFSCWTLRVMKY